MKKIWNCYSYAIILILLSLSIALVFSQKSHDSLDDDYVSITVSEGESLWNLSQKYIEKHNLSHQQFVNWVKKKNGIDGTIYVGDTLVIPVKEQVDVTELASLVENK